MTDNIRVALYQARYHGAAANKAASENEKLYTIVGKSCESSDILISDIYLPKLEAGDILAVLSPGLIIILWLTIIMQFHVLLL